VSKPNQCTKSILSALLGPALVVVACGGKAVVDPPGGDGGTGGTSSGTTSGTGGTGTGGTGTGNAAAGDPGPTDGVVVGDNQIMISLASFLLTCAETDPPPPDECGWWWVDIRMPVDKLVPGPIDFADPEVDSFSTSTTADPYDPNICSGSGGTFMGTVVIDAVGDTEVDMTVSDTLSFEIPAGSYTATRCM